MFNRGNGWNKHGKPVIPEPPKKEEPVVEAVVTPIHPFKSEHRPHMVKPYQNIPVPRYNKTYNSLRVEDGWQHTIDNYANGTITTIAGATATANVALQTKLPNMRLSQWPGAVQLYLCIRSFSIALSAASLATLGSLDMYYQDAIGGATIPLGNGISNAAISSVDNIIIPTPITDPGAVTLNVGQLQANLSAGATTATYVWQFGFSYVYLLPALKPYEVQHMEDILDGVPGNVH